MTSQLKRLIHTTQKTLRSLKERVQKMKEVKQEESSIERKLGKLLDKLPHKENATIVHLSGISIARATTIIVLLMLLAYLIFQIRGILLIIFMSLLFAAALDSAVDKLQKRGIPRALSVILIYIIIFLVLGIFISQLIPLVANQTIELASKAGGIISNISSGELKVPFSEKIQPYISQFLEGIDQETIIRNVNTALLKIGEQLQNVAGNAWTALKLLFNGIFNVILVLLLTFFFVTDDKGIEGFLRSLFPARYEDYIVKKSILIKRKIGSWLRGQLLLMLAIGILTFIGLTILNIEYAATLAMIALILELVPVIGPILSAIPALLIAANTSAWSMLWVIIIYFVIQQLENNVLVPIIMKKSVGLHPIVVLIAMLIGGKFLGILGVVLAVPVTTALSIFVKEYSERKK